MKNKSPLTSDPALTIRRTLIVSLIAISTLTAAPEVVFKTNCVACHQLENKKQPIVGPSLVEISHIYKKDLKGFLKWCNTPGKKRKNAVQMPSMAHVGNKDLEDIYHWILKSTKGKKYSPPKKTKPDPYALKGDAVRQPRIQRIFLPGSSPASIAITIDGNHSLCWDTTSCRLRYIWTGGFIDGYPYWKSNGSSIAKLTGSVYYKAPAELKTGITVGTSDESPQYKGYKIIDGLPVFSYTIGSMNITETIRNKNGSVAIQIKISDAPSEVKYKLGDLNNTRFIYSSGQLKDGALILTKKEATSFELTFKPKQ